MLHLAALAAALLLLAACSPLPALNALVPEDAFRRVEGVAYGSHPRQRLDVYIPRQAATPAPVVVFFYGGSWKGGNRGSYKFVAEALASRGFVAVVPDYRVFPQVRLKGFMADAADALAWTRREVSRHGGDPSRVFVIGHSAGAHIATMLAYDERYLRAAGLGRDAIRGVVGLAGPYDFVPTDPDYVTILSEEGAFARGLPVTYVRGGEPPTLLVTGSEDTTVSPSNTDRLVARLEAAGSPVTDRRFPYNHYTLVGRLAAPFRDEALLDTITGFIEAASGPNGR
jgi:acetyl esterase/lipase